MAGDEEESAWCSQSEAARRLSADGDVVTQQQISRYLDAWPEISRRAGDSGQPMLVDFEALKRHRTENFRVQEQKAGRATPEPDENADFRTRERRAAAELRELELAKAKNEVIPRAAVERAIQTAAVALQQAHRRTRFERAEALEATQDQRAKVALLAEHDISIEAAFAQALSALASQSTLDEEEQQGQELEIGEPASATATNAPRAEALPS